MGATHLAIVVAILVLCLPVGGQEAAPNGDVEEKVGVRPYELDWAGRVQDDHPPLVDFEDLDGWRVEVTNSSATFQRTREQQIWGRYVGKLTYRGNGTLPAEVRMRPPAPIPIKQAFDAVTLWCYGNNWGYAPDPQTPQVGITALFLDSEGREFGVYLYHVDWTEWYLLHRRLSPEQIERVRQGASFAGILVTGGKQTGDRVLYFDNLAVFTEEFPPLSFAPRPQRNLTLFPGQSSGTNTGPGRLPFPTTEKTILPPVLDTQARTSAQTLDNGARFVCTDRTGTVEYRYVAKTGRWDDIEIIFTPAQTTGSNKQVQPPQVRFRPCVEGGIWLSTSAGPRPPEHATLLAPPQLTDGVLTTRWRLQAGETTTEVTYRFRIWGKSLVVDVLAPGGSVAEVRYGKASGLANPRLVTHPYYPADGGRPATVVFDGPAGPLFLMGNTDWYRTNASVMWAVNTIDASGVTYNGGTRYIALTNGKRNDCFERFFLTLSPRIEECLPTIANPPSPWKHITGTRVWRPHGASDREADKRYWKNMHRHGIRQMVVTDHETMWRDGGESFTFRTRTAPGKGGDEGARDYARFMQDTLGYIYGPYNNFTDFAPVNEYWSTDMVSRDPENQLQHAWMRCYAPKPARAVEFCEKLSPINQAKFGFSTAYCDVHTAVAPWHRVDYDPRVPGAGTMAAVFYAYGEIMLIQKKAWNGPVYSEGNYHAFYCGLTDGNYGQDQSYRPAENPWLVDFDLLRMHDLGCNFGMGMPDMFYANAPQPQSTKAEREAWLDRFLAATAAFGHPGYLVAEGGMANAMKSYFMLQQLHSRYCLAKATDIRYVDGQGRLFSTSQAVANGTYRRSQVVVRYSDGTVVVANGSRTERLQATVFGRKVDLPPNGYCGWTPRRSGAASQGAPDYEIDVLSTDTFGHRADYAFTPEYIFVDGRGQFVRFPRAAGNGLGVCRKVRDGQWEIILLDGAECGFGVTAQSARALDYDGNDLGPAPLRVARGLTYVVPVDGAFSYLLEGVRLAPPRTEVTSARDRVTPGEEVIVRMPAGTQTFPVPADVTAGQRVWREFDGHWLDFTVAAPFDVRVELEGDDLVLQVTSQLPRAQVVEAKAFGATTSQMLEPQRPTSLRLGLGKPDREDALTGDIVLRAGEVQHTVPVGLLTIVAPQKIAAWPEEWSGGVCLRGGKEETGYGTTGAYVTAGRGECGGVAKRGLTMHPPWLGWATGYVYAVTAPISLPDSPAAAFRAVVGKLDGSDLGDGILYRVVVIDSTGVETVVAEHTVRQHRWEPLEADLSAWAGQRIRLKLIADPGPADNTSGDWACWADIRIESHEPLLQRRLVAEPERLRRAPSPYPLQGLKVADLRSARRGWLRYDGKGLNAGQYVTYGVLNGQDIGPLPAAPGDEQAGQFTENVAVELTPEAIRSLARRNTFVLRNPNQDHFSVRRFWIELELADGRRVASWIADVTFSQPSLWRFAEGITVPFEEEITVDIWFDVSDGQ